jgi:murein DD-endopeptidase MepM/ murein hydrolase activator NlpD
MPSDAAHAHAGIAWRAGQKVARGWAIALLGVLPALVATPPALAASGGAGITPVPAAPTGSSGGPAPVILDVRCVGNPGEPCVETHRIERGGTVRVSGRNLGQAAQLLFYGAKGERDDALAPVSAATPGSAVAIVPASARSGPVAILDGSGRRSLRWTGLVLDDPLSDFGTYQPLGAPSPVRVAVSKPRRIYYGGAQKAVFTYDVVGGGAMDLRVNLVRSRDGQIVQSWDRPASAPGAPARVIWSGSIGGRVPAEGRYAFRISALGAASKAGLRAAPSAPGDESVSLYGHVFPVRGSHDFGGAGAQFGAGRSGHSHQGQDVFAACGTPLVAARGGKVKFTGFHAAAGYYVVIDGKGTDTDYAYMHLRQRAAVRVGDAIYTGQDLGEVGETGNAVGCHLHFEEWSAPGWYDGGRPLDPLPDLQRWDRTS